MSAQSHLSTPDSAYASVLRKSNFVHAFEVINGIHWKINNANVLRFFKRKHTAGIKVPTITNWTVAQCYKARSKGIDRVNNYLVTY